MRSRESLLLSAVLCAALAACAKPSAEPDTTPQNPTSVLTAKFTINGKVLPENTGTQTVYTRADRRRMDHQRRFEGWTARMFFSDADTADIARLDRNLTWQIDKKRERYTECPLRGCTPFLQELMDKAQQGEAEEDDPLAREPGCALTTKKNDFTVKPTGQRRVINGFDSEEYLVTWKVLTQDKAGNQNSDTVTITFWNTQPTAETREMWKVHEAFQRDYLKRIGTPDNPLGRFLSEEVYMALAAFSGDISKEDKQWATRTSRELAKMKGWPVSIKLEWLHGGKACAPPPKEKKKKSLDFSGGLKGLLSGAAEQAVDTQKKQWQKSFEAAPVLLYVYEVTSAKMKLEHDSVFNLPAGYRLENRK